MTKHLRNQVHSISQHDSLTLWFLFTPYGYARINIDNELGSLVIQSDWGNWQHMWGGGPAQWGSRTFIDFLKARDSGHCEYLTDKLHYGRVRAVIDGDATAKALCDALDEKVKANHTNGSWAEQFKEQIRDFTRDVDGKEPNLCWYAWNERCDEDMRELFDPMELSDLMVTEQPSSMRYLNDEILPTLIAYLRGELVHDPTRNALEDYLRSG